MNSERTPENRNTGSLITKNLIILIVLVTVCSFSIWSWFTVKQTATADGISVSANTDEGVQVSWNGVNYYDNLTALSSSEVVAEKTGLAKNLCDEDGNPLSLGLVTGNGLDFFEPYLNRRTGMPIINDDLNWMGKEVDPTNSSGKYIDIDLYFRSDVERTVYLAGDSKVSPKNLNGNYSEYGDFSKDYIAAASRVAFLNEDKTLCNYIWAPNADIELVESQSGYQMYTTKDTEEITVSGGTIDIDGGVANDGKTYYFWTLWDNSVVSSYPDNLNNFEARQFVYDAERRYFVAEVTTYIPTYDGDNPSIPFFVNETNSAIASNMNLYNVYVDGAASKNLNKELLGQYFGVTNTNFNVGNAQCSNATYLIQPSKITCGSKITYEVGYDPVNKLLVILSYQIEGGGSFDLAGQESDITTEVTYFPLASNVNCALVCPDGGKAISSATNYVKEVQFSNSTKRNVLPVSITNAEYFTAIKTGDGYSATYKFLNTSNNKYLSIDNGTVSFNNSGSKFSLYYMHGVDGPILKSGDYYLVIQNGNVDAVKIGYLNEKDIVTVYTGSTYRINTDLTNDVQKYQYYDYDRESIVDFVKIEDSYYLPYLKQSIKDDDNDDVNSDDVNNDDNVNDESGMRTIYIRATDEVIGEYIMAYNDEPRIEPLIVTVADEWAYINNYAHLDVWVEDMYEDGSVVYGVKTPIMGDDGTTYPLTIQDQPEGIVNSLDYDFIIDGGYNLIDLAVIDGYLIVAYGDYTPVERDSRKIYFYVSSSISGSFGYPVTSLTDCVTGETFEVELIESETGGTLYSAIVPTYTGGMSTVLRITNGREWMFTIPADSNYAILSADGNEYSYYPTLRTIYVSASADVIGDYMCAYTEGPSFSPVIVYPWKSSYNGDIKIWTEELNLDGSAVFGMEVPCFDSGNTFSLIIEDQPVGIANERDIVFTVPADYNLIEYDVVNGSLDCTYGTYTTVEKDTREIFFYVDATAGTQFGNPIMALEDSVTGDLYTAILESSTNEGNIYSAKVPVYENGITTLVKITNGRECQFYIPSEYNYIKIEGMSFSISYDTLERESRTVYFYLPTSIVNYFGSPLIVVDNNYDIYYTTTKVEETSSGVVYAAYVKTVLDGSVNLGILNGPGVNMSFGSDDNCANISMNGSGTYNASCYWTSSYLRPVYVYVASTAQTSFSYPVTSFTVTGYGTYDATIVSTTSSGTTYSVMLPINEDGSTMEASISSGRTWKFSIPANCNCANVATGALTTTYDNCYSITFISDTPDLYNIIRYNDSGSIPFTSAVKEHGSTSFGISPVAGYAIEGVLINGKEIEAEPSYAGYSGTQKYYTLDNIFYDCYVYVTIKPDEPDRYPVTFTTNMEGTFGKIGAATEAEEGSDYTFSLALTDNHRIYYVAVNGVAIQASDSSTDTFKTYTVENVTSSLNIYVAIISLDIKLFTSTNSTPETAKIGNTVLTTLTKKNQNDEYYTAHIVMRVWVEGTDREAKTPLADGIFNMSLHFISQ